MVTTSDSFAGWHGTNFMRSEEAHAREVDSGIGDEGQREAPANHEKGPIDPGSPPAVHTGPACLRQDDQLPMRP